MTEFPVGAYVWNPTHPDYGVGEIVAHDFGEWSERVEWKDGVRAWYQPQMLERWTHEPDESPSVK